MLNYVLRNIFIHWYIFLDLRPQIYLDIYMFGKVTFIIHCIITIFIFTVGGDKKHYWIICLATGSLLFFRVILNRVLKQWVQGGEGHISRFRTVSARSQMRMRRATNRKLTGGEQLELFVKNRMYMFIQETAKNLKF